MEIEVCESAAEFFFSQPGSYLGWKDKSGGYCPAGTAAVRPRNICNYLFTLRRI